MKNNSIPITELLSFIVDNRGKTVPTTDKGMPLIATNCIKHSSIYPTFDNVRFVDNKTVESWFRAQPKPNDIIFVNKGTPGRVCLVPDPVPFCFAQDMIGFRCDSNKIDFEYLFAVLRSDYIQKTIENFHVGLVIPHFKKGDLGNLKIPRLNTRNQELSFGKLYLSLSKKIELNNRINAELQAMAKTLYDYWFVQFDFPDANGKPYKTAGGKMVYDPTLKREIPEGWEVNTIADWIANDKSGDWGKELAEGNYLLKVDCIRGTDISGINNTDSLEPPTRYILAKNNFKLLSPYELIIEISGGSPTQSTGRMAYLTKSALERFENPIICSNFCKAITLKDTNYFFNFAYQWSAIHQHGLLFGWEGKTSGIKNLLFEAFTSKHYVAKPPSELAKSFFEKASKIEEQKQSLLKQNAELSKLRDWLLPMLMNGQVTVKEMS